MFRLPAHGLFPIETKPGQVLMDCGFEDGSAAFVIDVLDAQEKSAPGLLSGSPAGEGGGRVTDMQESRGAGCKARDNHALMAWRRFLKSMAATCRSLPCPASSFGIGGVRLAVRGRIRYGVDRGCDDNENVN